MVQQIKFNKINLHMLKIYSIFVSLFKNNNIKTKFMNNITTKQEALNKLNEIETEQIKLRKIIEDFDKYPKLTFKDVINIDIAEDVLKDCKEHIKYYEHQFCRTIDWITYKLQTQIKAVNYLENGNKIWSKDWNNPNEYYYTPYFKMNGINNSFSYLSYDCWLTNSSVGFGWGFKNKELLLFGVDKWLKDYEIIFKGK